MKTTAKQKLVNALPGRGYIDVEEIKTWDMMKTLKSLTILTQPCSQLMVLELTLIVNMTLCLTDT